MGEIEMAIELNRENFETEVHVSKKPMLIDFWGPQCKPCLALLPAIEELEKDYEGRLKVAKINAAENRMLCAKLRVMSLPTLLLYRNGAETQRLTGEKTTFNEIKDAVEAMLS